MVGPGAFGLFLRRGQGVGGLKNNNNNVLICGTNDFIVSLLFCRDHPVFSPFPTGLYLDALLLKSSTDKIEATSIEPSVGRCESGEASLELWSNSNRGDHRFVLCSSPKTGGA